MSLYGDYIREREGFEIEENEYGFASYIIIGDECYIRDLYVVPEKRKEKIASQLADKIVMKAKEKVCKHLTGSVSMSANGITDSVKVLLAYGFKILKSDSNGIFFVKEI